MWALGTEVLLMLCQSLPASPTLASCISDPPRTYLSAASLAGVHHCIAYISDFSLIAVAKLTEEYKI